MYIYIFEDGRIGKSASEPGRGDLACVAAGTLTLLKCTSISVVAVNEVMEDKKLQPLAVAKFEQDEHGDYHYLEGHE